MGNPLKKEHISHTWDIYGSSSHRSINLHPHLFISELNAVDVKVIMAHALPGTCDSIRCNHARVGGLILQLLEFATEWKEGSGDILSWNKVSLSRSSASRQDIFSFVQFWKIMLAPGLWMTFSAQCSSQAKQLIISIYSFMCKGSQILKLSVLSVILILPVDFFF